MNRSYLSRGAITASLASLVLIGGCGGNRDSSTSDPSTDVASGGTTPPGVIASSPSPSPPSVPSPPPPPAPAPPPPSPPVTASPVFSDKPTNVEAARFLTQATFGPSMESIAALDATGFRAWLSDQWAKPQTLMQPAIQANEDAFMAAHAGKGNISGITDKNGFSQVWWGQVVLAPDQLRQRVAFALSEIFVISMVDDNVKYQGIPLSTYYDALGRDASGNFRTLLEDVTLHPLMGQYLTWYNNKKEVLDASGNVVRQPDQNYSREVMQLFTIGLNQLNLDGTPKLDSSGNTIPTYSGVDIFGMSKVLTGWVRDSAPAGPLWFSANIYGVPMVPGFTSDHSISEKKFLGVTIPATTSATAASMRSELKTLLDTLFNHPNVGPFIGKQLIQRLVTSNPSPAYVRRVATVFNDNGSGVRGDLKAVVEAVLMDPEAHDLSKVNDTGFGKVREPVLRLSHWLRAFHGTSPTANYGIEADNGGNSTLDSGTRLSQVPMLAPSVFNFFAPGYSPPVSALGSAKLLAPEMQVTNELSVVGYQTLMKTVIQNGGFGNAKIDTSAELALVDDAHLDALMTRLDLLLTEGQMPSDLKTEIKTAVQSIQLQNAAGTTKGDTERNRRLWTAIYLTMASPEYIVQK